MEWKKGGQGPLDADDLAVDEQYQQRRAPDASGGVSGGRAVSSGWVSGGDAWPLIAGAEPTGLYTTNASARRGHQVAVIDSDGAGRTAGSGVTRLGKQSGHERGV